MNPQVQLSSYISEHRNRITETLLAWLSIPSISAHPVHDKDVAASAEFLAELCRDAGLTNVEVLATAGQPAVVAE